MTTSLIETLTVAIPLQKHANMQMGPGQEVCLPLRQTLAEYAAFVEED